MAGHQFQQPRSATIDDTSNMRTAKASMRMPDRERGEDALVDAASGLSPHHQGEDAEGAREHEPGRGDRRSGVFQGPGHRLPQQHPAGLLADPGHDQDVVVLAEGQQEHEHEERDQVIKPAGAGGVLEEQHGRAKCGQAADRHRGDEVDRGDEAAQDERKQDRDDDVLEVSVGGLAHVIGGGRLNRRRRRHDR